MPKLDDYDDSHATNPLSPNAQQSLSNKFGTGGSLAPSTTTPTNTFGQSTSVFGGATAPLASSPSTGFGTAPTTGFGTSSGFGGFGSTNTNAGFGSTTGFGSQPGQLNPQSQALQSTGGAMQEGGTAAIATDGKFGDFINSRWRPMMAVIYMITCTTDFVIFPVLWSVLQAVFHGTVTSQWQPLTLQGAGLYHIAMGAVLGLAAYGRSQEKIAGKA
jgi:hypothetical protein